MVGDRNVFVPLVRRGPNHRGQVVAAVARSRVHLEVAAQVPEFHEVGELPLPGRFDLAAIFAQLRRDPGQADRLGHLALGAPADALLPLEHAVLVDLEAALQRHPPDGDVVGLRAGEVVERRPEALLRHDAHVNLKARGEPDRRPGLAPLEHLPGPRGGGEGLHGPPRIRGDDQQVEIAHGLTAAPEAPGQFHMVDPSNALHLFNEVRGIPGRGGPGHPRCPHRPRGQLGAELRLGAGAEAGHRAHAVLLERPAELRHRPDAQRGLQRLDALRAEAAHLQQLELFGRDVLPELAQKGYAAFEGQLSDGPGEILADARQVLQHRVRPGVHDGDGLGEGVDGSCGVAVGPHPEGIRLVEFKQVADFAQQAGDVGVGERSVRHCGHWGLRPSPPQHCAVQLRRRGIEREEVPGRSKRYREAGTRGSAPAASSSRR